MTSHCMYIVCHVSVIAAECDRNCYVTANLLAFPAVCENEFDTAYDMLSVQGDTDPATISGQDIEAWCESCSNQQALVS